MNETNTALQQHQHLRRFAEAGSVAERAAALTALMSDRAIARVSKTAEFSRGIQGLLDCVSSDADPLERLGAIAQLMRVSQAVKPLGKALAERMPDLMREGLPPVDLLKDGDDRAYVAQACQLIDAGWVGQYAAQSAAREEVAERARTEFVAVLFARANAFSDVLQLLREPVWQLKFQTDSPGDSIGRRLTRLLGALREHMARRRLKGGEQPGRMLAELIKRPLEFSGFPQELSVQIGLAREIVLITDLILHTRFSLATDANAYAAIRIARQLFGSSAWPKALASELDDLIDTVTEAILLLAKQGIPSDPLIGQLALLVDDRGRADALMRDFADKHSDLPEPIRAWMRRQRYIGSSPEVSRIEASESLRADPLVGNVLVESYRLEESRLLIETSVLPTVRVLDPGQVHVLETLDSRIRTILHTINGLATARRMGLLGSPGQEIPYQPKYFELVQGSFREKMLVVRPAVVRMADDGSPTEVVLKGLLE
jgi:hypothetical protein